jgi:hypothetical protein
MENFHLAVTTLRCFDATAYDDTKKICFNWFARDNKFSFGARRAPPYTDIFWILFFKMAANLGDMSKEILEASTPDEIDALLNKTVKVVVDNGCEPCKKEIKMISPAIRAMIDNICYMAVYGHSAMLNERVPAARTFAFTDSALKAAKDNEEKFFEAWKTYRAANPFEKEHERGLRGQGDDSEAERIKKLLDDSDDEPAAAAAAANGD